MSDFDALKSLLLKNYKDLYYALDTGGYGISIISDKALQDLLQLINDAKNDKLKGFPLTGDVP